MIVRFFVPLAFKNNFNENIKKSNLLWLIDKRPNRPLQSKTQYINITKKLFNQDILKIQDLILIYSTLSNDTINRISNNNQFLNLININKLNNILDDNIKLYNNINIHNNCFNNTIIDSNSEYDNYYAHKITIPSNSKIHIIGDIHGSLQSLIYALCKNLKNNFNEDLTLKPNNYLFFTGDLVDYSQLGIEVLYLVLYLKNKNPNNIFICDGNHEDKTQYKSLDGSRLQHEIEYDLNNDINISNKIDILLNMLPTVIFVKINKSWFQFNHGSHPTKEGSDKLLLKQFLESDKIYHNFGILENKLITKEDYSWSFKWGDFDQTVTDKTKNRPLTNIHETKEYLDYLNIKCILSGHQDVLPISILTDQVITEMYNNYKSIKHKYPLFRQEYNLLSFPGLNLFGSTKYAKYENEKYKYNKTIVSEPTENSYKYIFDINKPESNNILALIQSISGFSHGKLIPWVTTSTLELT